MTLLGLTGMLLGLLSLRVAIIEITRTRLAVFFALYLFHLIATFAYYQFSLNSVTDASGYYEDYLNFYEDVGLGYGTLFVIFVVQWLKNFVGGTFLDYFLLFQAISFFGIAVLMRIVEEIYRELGIDQPVFACALLFIPGLHFWTSPIGKDGFLLLGSSLAIWAAMNLHKRYVAMGLALIIMLVIRPYTGPVVIVAIAGMMFFDRGTPQLWKIAMVGLSLGGLAVVATAVQQSFGVDITDADSVSDFLASHEQVTQDAETAGNSAVYGSYPFKLMSLLFRPLFLDAENLLGMAASTENVVFLGIFGTIIAKFRTTWLLARRLSFVRYSLLFGTAMALLLAVTYFNIGLGLRHKTMFLPAFIVVFITVIAVGRARKFVPAQHRASPKAPRLPPLTRGQQGAP